LDHKLTVFSAALPARIKLRGRTTKHALRASMEALRRSRRVAARQVTLSMAAAPMSNQLTLA